MNFYQVNEDDLCELERTLPQLADELLTAAAMSDSVTGRVKTQLRRVKAILSNVRWNYGPHDDGSVVRGDND